MDGAMLICADYILLFGQFDFFTGVRH